MRLVILAVGLLIMAVPPARAGIPVRPEGGGAASVGIDGGGFIPVGGWSEGFSPGVALGGGIDLPFRNRIEIGGRISKAEISLDDRGVFDWLAMEAQFTYYPPLASSPADIFLAVRGGVLKASLGLGEGKEEEWDLLTGLGGGILLPISEEFYFRAMGLWSRALADGQGFYFGGGFVFPLH